MNARTELSRITLTALGLGLLFVGLVWTKESYTEDSQALFNFSDMGTGDDSAEEGVKPLTRGPVHEAFAGVVSGNPAASPFVPKAPPSQLQETPPTDKPEGENILWIAGYWSWDDDQDEYIWISGLWRNMPPGRQWVPGRWEKSDAGYQWVPGLWADAKAELSLLPPPPAPKEEDAGTAPTAESIYAPGHWEYRGSEYIWTDGFWYQHNPEWVWVNAHYCWSPAGYIFVPGFWDRHLRVRGLLFAPVLVEVRMLGVPGFSYCPRHVVHDQCLLGALFVRPSVHSYYFGDFFDPRYDAKGYRSWVSYGGSTKLSYDPLFSYYQCRNRTDPKWETELRSLYTGRRAGTIARPPQTMAQQLQLVNDLKAGKVKSDAFNTRFGMMCAPLQKLDRKVVSIKPLDAQGRAEIIKRGDAIQTLGQQRGQLERNLVKFGKTPTRASDAARVLKLDIPKSEVTKQTDVKVPQEPKVIEKLQTTQSGNGNKDQKNDTTKKDNAQGATGTQGQGTGSSQGSTGSTTTENKNKDQKNDTTKKTTDTQGQGTGSPQGTTGGATTENKNKDKDQKTDTAKKTTGTQGQGTGSPQGTTGGTTTENKNKDKDQKTDTAKKTTGTQGQGTGSPQGTTGSTTTENKNKDKDQKNDTTQKTTGTQGQGAGSSQGTGGTTTENKNKDQKNDTTKKTTGTQGQGAGSSQGTGSTTTENKNKDQKNDTTKKTTGTQGQGTGSSQGSTGGTTTENKNKDQKNDTTKKTTGTQGQGTGASQGSTGGTTTENKNKDQKKDTPKKDNSQGATGTQGQGTGSSQGSTGSKNSGENNKKEQKNQSGGSGKPAQGSGGSSQGAGASSFRNQFQIPGDSSASQGPGTGTPRRQQTSTELPSGQSFTQPRRLEVTSATQLQGPTSSTSNRPAGSLNGQLQGSPTVTSSNFRPSDTVSRLQDAVPLSQSAAPFQSSSSFGPQTFSNSASSVLPSGQTFTPSPQQFSQSTASSNGPAITAQRTFVPQQGAQGGRPTGRRR